MVFSKGALFKNLTVFFVSNKGEILIKCKGCGKITEAPINVLDKVQKEDEKFELMRL